MNSEFKEILKNLSKSEKDKDKKNIRYVLSLTNNDVIMFQSCEILTDQHDNTVYVLHYEDYEDKRIFYVKSWAVCALRIITDKTGRHGNR